MKDKLLVNIKLPATMQNYEFRLPYDLTVEDCAQLVARILAAREPARYEVTYDADFMFLEGEQKGTILNPKDTIRNLILSWKIVDGSCLMLV